MISDILTQMISIHIYLTGKNVYMISIHIYIIYIISIHVHMICMILYIYTHMIFIYHPIISHPHRPLLHGSSAAPAPKRRSSRRHRQSPQGVGLHRRCPVLRSLVPGTVPKPQIIIGHFSELNFRIHS